MGGHITFKIGNARFDRLRVGLPDFIHESEEKHDLYFPKILEQDLKNQKMKPKDVGVFSFINTSASYPFERVEPELNIIFDIEETAEITPDDQRNHFGDQGKQHKDEQEHEEHDKDEKDEHEESNRFSFLSELYS